MERLDVMSTRLQLKMADKQDTKDDLVVVGPGADEEVQEGTPAEAGNDAAGDDYQYPDGDPDVDGRGEAAAQDERTGHSEDDGADDSGLSREQKRRRRKREKYERDQRELAFLRSRNEQLERDYSQRMASVETRQSQSDVLAIDGRISQATNDVREAESLFAQAVKSGDEGAIAEALRVRDELRDGLNQLRGVKQNTLRAAQERQSTANQPPGVDPAIAARAKSWADSRPWFDPQARDEDSAIAYAVEQSVFREGRLSPTSNAYWAEVDRRLARRLPEHYRDARGREDDGDEDDDEPRSEPRRNGRVNPKDTPRRPSGPTIKVGGRERTLRKGEVFIDEDRKQAMIEKGVWDDRVLRERQLKYYQNYDREAGRRPR